MVFLNIVEITSCVYTKTIIFSMSVNSGFKNIYLDFKE